MRIADFDIYKDLLEKHSGLSLSPNKSYLLDSRLTPVSKKWGFHSLEAMTVALRAVPSPELVHEIVEAMTTNETSFFRDAMPFELFQTKILPYFAKKRAPNRSLRIWCAAGSSGQEPYSLAITILENKALVPGWKIEILATDISDKMLEKARSGAYTQFEAQRGLPVHLLLKYFEQNGEHWAVKPEVRKMVKFQPFNLLNDMTPLGMFDIIFCRNVLIYFNEKTKTDVLERMAKRLPSDGVLCLGGAETVLGVTDEFQPLDKCRGLYVLRNSSYSAIDTAEAAAR